MNNNIQNPLKLYKFRPLGTELDLCRLKSLIETGYFWCSKLWDLNDPMEGVYRNSNFNREDIDKIFSDKNRYLICSFSGEKGFNNPLLWGYYANGFKGAVIEIRVEKDNKSIQKMDYLSEEKFRENMDDAKKIITRKLKKWKHEDEYRYLIESSENKQKIGKIIKVHFGNPYGNLNNTDNVIRESKSLKSFLKFKQEIIEICKSKNIEYQNYCEGE